jgi:hypothetical protein|tara:strand:+ start:338 stop:583 length:246 start_codon:yes stop_codon:yes gene_type:complete
MTFPTGYLINQVEYGIRKTERAIKVLYFQGADANEIIKYGEKREGLQDRLERLTEERYFSSGRWKVLKKGRREPLSPEWPV